MVQRRVALLGVLIDQHGVALREGAALAVLAGQAHRMALDEQRAESQRLARRPVDAVAGLDRLAPVVEEALDRRCTSKPFGQCGDRSPMRRSVSSVDAGVAAARIFLVGLAALHAGPGAVEPVGLVRLDRLRRPRTRLRARLRQSACIFSTSPLAMTPSATSRSP